MEWVETTAKTVDQAKEAALDQLGIDHDDAEFEVLEEPRAGLFGRVRGEARVRARVAPKAPRPKQDRRPRRKSRGSGRDDSRHRSRSEGSKQGAAAAAASPRPAKREDSPVSDQAPEAHHAERADSRPSGGRERSTGREGRGEPTRDDRPVLTVAEEGELVADFLEGLVDAFGLDARVETTPIDDDTVQVDVNGEGLGLLVGPRGRTLSAVQELSRTVLQRKAGGGFQGRVRVDVGGYRAKRHEALARFVTQIAEGVVTSGEASALEPMNPPDRKVVHDTVNGIEGASTRSEGEEPRRYVVITPDAS